MDTLEKLIVDHERLRDVLAILKDQLTAVEAAENADPQVMNDIVAHYSEYFNHVHHPLEDRVFEYMLRRGAVRQHDVGQASMKHIELIRHTARFWSLLEEILYDGIIPREALVRAGWQFFNAHLDHMAQEERIAFAWARKSLNEGDWAAINSQPVARDHRATAPIVAIRHECAAYMRHTI